MPCRESMRRFRHVSQVHVRNVQSEGTGPIDTFLTANIEGDSSYFIRSSVVQKSLNPTFIFSECTDKSSFPSRRNRLTLRLWDSSKYVEAKADQSPIFETTFDLADLHDIGITKMRLYRFPPNTVLVVIDDKVLSVIGPEQLIRTGEIIDSGINRNESSLRLPRSSLAVDTQLDVIKGRDSVLSSMRSIQGQRHLQSLQLQLNEVTERLSEALLRKFKETHAKRRRQELSVQMKAFVQKINDQSLAVEQLRGFVEATKAENTRRSERLLRSRVQLQERSSLLQERSTDILKDRPLVSGLDVRLSARRSKLMQELRGIYTISTPFAQEQNFYLIRNIKVPTSNITAEDQEGVSAALGYICHLLLMISKYLNIPLRYRIHFRASRSFISDEVSSTGSNLYPLYFRGVEKEKFECGVILLNRVLNQILRNRCVVSVDSRLQLDNPARLLENLSRLFASEVP